MPPIGRELSPGHRVVSGSMLPEQLVECPHCGCKNFTVHGSYERGFEQAFQDSNAKEVALAQVATQTVEGLVCTQCGIHTLIEDEDVFEREMLIFDLRTQIATLQGRVVISQQKEWKQ